MPTIDTNLILIWLCASILTAILGVWIAYRRSRPLGTITYTAGMSLLAASIYYLYPALVRQDLGSDVERLKDNATFLNTDLSRERQRRALAESVAANARATSDTSRSALALAQTELGAERRTLLRTHEELNVVRGTEQETKRLLGLTALSNARLAQKLEQTRSFQGKARAAIDKLKLELGETKAKLAELEAVNVELGTQLQKEKAQNSIKDERLALLDGRLARADESNRTLATKLAEQENEGNNLRRAAEELRIALQVATRSERKEHQRDNDPPRPNNALEWLLTLPSIPGFNVLRQEDGEIVEGSRGIYLIISFNNKTSGERLIFPARKFVLKSSDDQLFRESLRALKENILDRLRGNAHYELFVKGAADRGGPIGALPAANRELRAIEYLKLTSASPLKYSRSTATQKIEGNYDNSHLPILRSAYTRDIAKEVLGEVALILEGTVQAGASEIDRNTQMILWIRPPGA